jgi:hypothetical protein
MDQYTKKSHDNHFCGWLYSLIFTIATSRWGGSSRELAHPAHGHCKSVCTARKHIENARNYKQRRQAEDPGFIIYKDIKAFNNKKPLGRLLVLPESAKQEIIKFATLNKENCKKLWDQVAIETSNNFLSYLTIKKSFYKEGYTRY